MEILAAKQVHFSYTGRQQTVHALRGVSCGFEPGLLYAIVGRSGSGKTTFLSLLAGLELSAEGEILVDGVSTRKLNCDLLRRDQISVIYQSYNLFPLLTAEENVCYPLHLKGKTGSGAREKARECLSAVGLTEAQFRRFPAQLSGGEQQRVAIARALASGARILLADEPTGNLDDENSRNIMAILRDLAHERGCCVILVTHDMTVANASDCVCSMADGRLTFT